MHKQILPVVTLAVIFVLAACSSPATGTLPSTQDSSPTQGATVTTTVEPSTTPSPTATPTAASVTAFPDPASYQFTEVAGGLSFPIDLTNAGDGTGRMFILEKQGDVRVVSGGQLQSTPFLDIRDRVRSSGSEQGLLGIAFSPDFKQNGYFYVDYIDLNGNTVISRFSADPTASPSSQAGDPASEKIILTVEQPYSNHNGGHIIFGPDGYLYIGMGDGGSAGDPKGNGQNLNTLLGKMLRIDVNHGDPYSIPAGNPFANSSGGLPEIWAYGLRNPWQFSFDPLTGDLYIGDVGQDNWEEIDYLPSGYSALPANFGWSLMEGDHPYKPIQNMPADLISPVAEYSHAYGCSVTGGDVYRGKSLAAFYGIYLYSDYCSGTVWGLIHEPDGSWQNQTLFETGVNVTGFGTDENGELYFVSKQGGLYELAAK